MSAHRAQQRPRDRARPVPGGAGVLEGTLCGEMMSSCWYGQGKLGVHFCSNHRAAWEDFRRNGATEKADEATTLTEVDELLGSWYCEPSRMERTWRRNEVGKSTLQFCVQGTFNCEDDALGEIDAQWLKAPTAAYSLSDTTDAANLPMFCLLTACRFLAVSGAEEVPSPSHVQFAACAELVCRPFGCS